jgi:hypothetical protein
MIGNCGKLRLNDRKLRLSDQNCGSCSKMLGSAADCESQFEKKLRHCGHPNLYLPQCRSFFPQKSNCG